MENNTVIGTIKWFIEAMYFALELLISIAISHDVFPASYQARWHEIMKDKPKL